MTAMQHPPGWYPNASGTWQWWDGAAWTSGPTSAQGRRPRRVRVFVGWAVGGFAIVVLAVVAVVFFSDRDSGPVAADTPTLAVEYLHQSYYERSCDTFWVATTANYRRLGGVASCQDFEGELQMFEAAGSPRMEILGESQVSPDSYAVTARQTWEPQFGIDPAEYTFVVLRDGDGWAVDAITWTY
jgi:hypothetical protein